MHYKYIRVLVEVVRKKGEVLAISFIQNVSTRTTVKTTKHKERKEKETETKPRKQIMGSSIITTFLSLVLLLSTITIITVESFSITTLATTNLRQQTRRQLTRVRTSLYASALIIQNKGGGHGEIGYHLVNELLSSTNNIDTITVLQDDSCKMTNEPFVSYANDFNDKVTVIYAPLATIDNEQSIQTLLNSQSYTYIYDNYSKDDTGFGKAIIDYSASSSASNSNKEILQLHVYISSAGVYKPDTTTHGQNPLDETTTSIKTSAGQHLYDTYAKSKDLPYVSFRPQYIYGPKANKFDYLDYFFDRIVRQLPIPIPYDGKQLVSITNVQDVVSILVSPFTNIQAATNQCIFNCGTDQLLSYNDLVYECCIAANISKDTVQIEYFNPITIGTKGNFPFRETDFYVIPTKVQSILNWNGSKHKLQDDLVWYHDQYKNKRNGYTKKVSNLIKDWEIVCGCKSTLPEYTSSIYEQYDPMVVLEE